MLEQQETESLPEGEEIENILLCLDGDDLSEKADAIEKLSKIPDVKAIKGLARFLDEDDEEIKLKALRYLIAHSDPRAKNPIFIALGNSSETVRRESAKALSGMGIHTGELVYHALNNDGRAMEKILSLREKKVIAPLLKARVGKNMELRFRSDEILSRMGDFAIPQLLSALSNNNEEIRIQSAVYLGRLKNYDALISILGLLESGDRESAAKTAMVAFRSLGLEESAGFILRALEEGKHPASAIIALGLLKNRKALEKLLALAGDGVQELRVPALSALSEIGNTLVLKQLLELEKAEQDKNIKKAVHRTIELILEKNRLLEGDLRYLYCPECLRPFERMSLQYSFFKKYSFYACPGDNNSDGVTVACVLDNNMKEARSLKEKQLYYNWSSNRDMLYFAKILIGNVDGDTMNEFFRIAILENQDEEMKNWLLNTPVTLLPHCSLNSGQMEIIMETFRNVEDLKGQSREILEIRNIEIPEL